MEEGMIRANIGIISIKTNKMQWKDLLRSKSKFFTINIFVKANQDFLILLRNSADQLKFKTNVRSP